MKWTKAETTLLIEQIHAGKSYDDIAGALGKSYASVEHKAARLGLKTRAIAFAAAGADTKTLAGPMTIRILSLTELLAHSHVDAAVWEVDRWITNKWEMGAKHPLTGEILTAPLYQVKAWLKRKKTDVAKIVAQLLEDIKADTVRRVALRDGAIVADDPHGAGPCMVEACLFDIHIGKLAHASEVGNHYDSRLAEAAAREALTDLLWQAARYPVERIVLPIGNDFYHFDNLAGTTTGGTPQDRDSRYHKMFRRGRGLASWMIDTCARVAPTDVVFVPGNHDELLAWHLGEVISAEFAADERVTVDNGAKLRKYVLYGRNLIGYTHGRDEPLGKLPQIMATEVPQMWAQSDYREWHTGHLHTSKVRDAQSVDSHQGVRVRTIRSLSGTDKWHYQKGYIGEPREAEAFVWRHAGGLRANLFTQVGRAVA